MVLLVEDAVASHLTRDLAADTYVRARAQLVEVARLVQMEMAKSGKLTLETRIKLDQVSTSFPLAQASYQAHVARVILLVKAANVAKPPDYVEKISAQAQHFQTLATEANERCADIKQVQLPRVREIATKAYEIKAAEVADKTTSANDPPPRHLILDREAILEELRNSFDNVPASVENWLLRMMKDPLLFESKTFKVSNNQITFVPSCGATTHANRSADELEATRAASIKTLVAAFEEADRAKIEWSSNRSRFDAIQHALEEYDRSLKANGHTDVVMSG